MAVNYNRVNFKNRVVQYPRSYSESTNSGGGITHTPSPGFVVQEGNLPTEENMNQMDKGIKDCADAINEMLQTLQSIQAILSRYNSRITSNENSITAIRTVDAQQSTDIESVTQAHSALAGNVATDETAARNHYNNYSNPHLVTKAQVGLGNVPNVATNNQTPTYTEASTDANLSSGETMATAFGKLARGLRSLWAHIARRDNPHGVTKSQVQLGNVPNVTTNNQTPTYTEAATDANLTSGETMATAFGKLQRAVRSLWAHIADEENPHNTGLFDASSISIYGGVGEPDAVGYFVGNGSNAGSITVNGQSRRGQRIDLGFAPSRVAILVPKTAKGMTEKELFETDVTSAMAGKYLFGAAIIFPGENYCHYGCPASFRTCAPETLLGEMHGGACIYGNGFIVQSYQLADNDETMHMNCKGVEYQYMAWR